MCSPSIIYMPTFMTVCVSWMSFWLDYKSAPTMVMHTITTLLAMSTTTSSINSSLPPVAYTKVNMNAYKLKDYFKLTIILQNKACQLKMTNPTQHIFEIVQHHSGLIKTEIMSMALFSGYWCVEQYLCFLVFLALLEYALVNYAARADAK